LLKFLVEVYCFSGIMVLFKPPISIETLLENQLKEAGNYLFNLPSSIDELLTLLDRVENLLANVEQAPSKSMHECTFTLN
jgi:hypothetical protein